MGYIPPTDAYHNGNKEKKEVVQEEEDQEGMCLCNSTCNHLSPLPQVNLRTLGRPFPIIDGLEDFSAADRMKKEEVDDQYDDDKGYLKVKEEQVEEEEEFGPIYKVDFNEAKSPSPPPPTSTKITLVKRFKCRGCGQKVTSTSPHTHACTHFPKHSL